LDLALRLPRQRETGPEFIPDRAALVAAFFREAVNEGDLTILSEFAHPGLRDLSDDRLFEDGIEGLRFAVEHARRAMPDIYGRILCIKHTAADIVEIDLGFTATYTGSPLAPSGRQGLPARWRQRHSWSFLGSRVNAHRGYIDRATLRATLGDPY